MLISLNNFDPISFLEIDVTTLHEEKLTNLRNSLNFKLGKYVLLKFSDSLSDEQIEKVSKANYGEEIYKILKETDPDIDNKIIQELENFKREYQSTI